MKDCYFKHISLGVCVVCVSGVLAAAVNAQERTGSIRWGLGVGGIIEDDGYLGLGSETNLLPVLHIETERFQLLGYQLQWNLAEFEHSEFSFVGGYRFDGFEADDADELEGMEDRDGTVDIGFSYEVETRFGDFEVSAVRDALSKHKGFEVSLEYGLTIPVWRGSLRPYVAYSYMSEDLANYYFGVEPDEAGAHRFAYEVGSASKTTFGVDSLWRLGDRHSLKFELSYTAFDSAIADSPIMERDDNPQLLFGYWYAF
ncbi:MAG: MipA/OmpV family protein [Pseudomonadota bacterium]